MKKNFKIFQIESQQEESDLDLMSPTSSVPVTDSTADLEEHLSSATYTSTPVSLNENTTGLQKKRKTTVQNKAQDVLEKVNKQLERNEKRDNFDDIGKNFANKLRELPKVTSIIAEKMINDILYEAQMGNISRYSKVVLQDTRTVEPIITNPTTQSTLAQYYSSIQPLTPIQTTQAQVMPEECYSSVCSSLQHTSNFSCSNEYDV